MSENTSRKRLGKGLAALIGDIEMPDSLSAPAPMLDSAVMIEAEAQRQAQNRMAEAQSRAVQANMPAAAERQIEIASILRNEHNPRRFFAEEDIADLAQSIREHGVVQPIIVRPSPKADGYFELIAGERRWRAAKQAGLTEIPVLVRDVDDRTALELAIIENVQRADLNPVEEALGYRMLTEEHGYNQADLAQIIGKSRSHLANMMRLLKLPDDVLEKLRRGELTMGHARCLINAENPSALARQIVEKGLSVRQAENLAMRGEAEKPAVRIKEKEPHMLALEHNLGENLGLPVSINLKNKSNLGDGGGDIRIHYKNLDELDIICRRLERA